MDENNERGIALFFILWVLILLSVIVGQFCYSMRTEVNITRNFKEETQAYYIANAGLNKALYELLKQNYLGRPATVGEDGISWRINTEIPDIPFGDGFFRPRIDNESGKVNINRRNSMLLDMVFSHFGLEDDEKYSITESIKDWIDIDSNVYGNGAEDDYYKNLDPPYLAKDHYIDSVGEILMIKGISEEMFYKGLKDVFTLYEKIDLTKLESMNRNRNNNRNKKKTFDYSKINLNAASKEMLLFLPEMTEELADAVLDYRKEKDFQYISQLVKIVGVDVYSKIARYLTLEKTKFYMLSSKGFIGNGLNNSRVKALIQLDYKEKKGYRILGWYDNG